MPLPMIPSVAVLSLEEARDMEARLFGGDEAREWAAMTLAGRSVARSALEDFGEVGAFPAEGRVLVLAGKGNNAGDALIAARAVLEQFQGAAADVLFALGERQLRPLAARAWRELCDGAPGRVRSVGAAGLRGAYDLCIGAIFGSQFRPPLPAEALEAIAAASLCRARLRVAVDLPSGLDEEGAFAADFTYATGSVKAPIMGCVHAGRPRFLDLGFFDGKTAVATRAASGDRVLLRSLLDPLAGLRPAACDKRSFGHLVIVGGSGALPGAVLMATLSALRSGAGLVTSLVPARLAGAFAARAPEAMWVGLPETADGALSRAGLPRIVQALSRATALLVGPGLGRDPETLALAEALAGESAVPLVIDADALQPRIVRAGSSRRILTPHAGEFARIAKGQHLRALCSEIAAAVVQKGPVTRISDGGAVYHSFFGGPVLARGGSGDLLAGLVGGLLAQTPDDPLLAACRGAVWHGVAADLLARSRGQTSVELLEWLECLAPSLRGSVACRAS